MSEVIDFLIGILGYVMKFCYFLLKDYGLSIILFTLITKAVLFPLSIMTQKNSIRMVQLQPKLDELKIKYIDDKDKFTDEQVALYKKYKYNPFLDTVPLLLQIPIVLGLVGVIYRPLSFVLDIGESTIGRLNDWIVNTVGITDAGNMFQLSILEQLKNGAVPPADIPADALQKINEFGTHFLGIDLGSTPSFTGDPLLLLIPLLAGLSAWLLCFAQNKLNVLQLAQGNLNKILTTVFMVGFSTYFAFIVPCGVGLYWIFGNLFAIPLLVVTNLVLPPKKYVDYDMLLRTREEKKRKEAEFRKYRKREAADYKRFFEVKDMKLMFYSESNGFYKYYAGMLDYIRAHSDITVHYVTSDPNDRLFTNTPSGIVPYYIASDRYLVPLFMKLDCDMCVMTMPDLEKYHIKRSRVRNDIEYVFACHGIGSIITYRKGALDHYDTILCPGKAQYEEIRASEKLYGTHEKLIVEAGYPLIDDMVKQYKSTEHKKNDPPQIMIAPSWQPDNIISLCGEELIDRLSETGYRIILRPHPQHVRHEPETFAAMKEKYAGNDLIEIQTDFSQNNPVMESDLLITDWSDIAWEFAFTTKRPVLYIDTPMKVMNPEFDRLNIEPINKSLRTSLGRIIGTNELENAASAVKEMLADRERYAERIDAVYKDQIYNIGRSGELCGRYIIRSLGAK
ncbi:MAG: membrane protein insertase YidC [Ruminiclostridium sp.]|nr:membrane protein insertase YidC [Ruminiclostridium sp.]